MRMRFTHAVSLSAAAVLLVFFSGITASAQTITFTENLSLGSSDAQVLALQQLLNKDPSTQLATAGPGSLGDETGYFGALTKAAVIRFQDKHASEVLAPAGLTQGSGYVGSYTRAELNALSTTAVVNTGTTNPTIPFTTVPPPITVSPPAASAPTATSQNADLQNLDAYLAAIQAEGVREGFSQSTLAAIETQIRANVATSTDVTQQFFDGQKALYEKQIAEDAARSPVLGFFEKAFSLVAEPFYIERAYAATGLPFGGYISAVYDVCTCSPVVTQLFISLPNVAPPEVSNLLLNYVDGTEAFADYNIPEPTIATLGEYTPGVLSCLLTVTFGCVPIPSEGQLLPLVGSSFAP